MDRVINRTGEKYFTNEGYEIEIIECFGNSNCTIKFDDDKKTVLKKLKYYSIRIGAIKNPNKATIFGVGYFGIGSYNGDDISYAVWQGMIKRCYSLEDEFRNYKDVTVCEEWHNFQNFAKWYHKNCIKNFHIDKDILSKSDKIYSPKTCAFVPCEINNLFVKPTNRRLGIPLGVKVLKTSFKSQISKYGKVVSLGTFGTIEEAFQAYKIAKEAHIKEVADKWRGQITEKVYKVMYNHSIKITD